MIKDHLISLQGLKRVISKNIPKAFSELSKVLEVCSSEYNTLAIQIGRYNDLERKKIDGLLTSEEECIELAKIRNSLLLLVDRVFSNQINGLKALDVQDEFISPDINDVLRIDKEAIEYFSNVIIEDYDNVFRVLKRVNLAFKNCYDIFEKSFHDLSSFSKNKSSITLKEETTEDDDLSKRLGFYNYTLNSDISQQLPFLIEVAISNHIKLVQSHFYKQHESIDIWQKIYDCSLSIFKLVSEIEENIFSLENRLLLLSKEPIPLHLRKELKNTYSLHVKLLDIVNHYRRHCLALNKIIMESIL